MSAQARTAARTAPGPGAPARAVPDSARIVAPDLEALADFFDPEDLDWKPGATTRDKKKGLAMAYVTARAVQDRLDSVCGPGGWKNEFQRWGNGGVLCGLSIRVAYADGTSAWVTKWNGADESDIESTKGGLSNATKRTAVEWGIGRYLYEIPDAWVPLDDRGRFASAPRVPREYLPGSEPRRAAGSDAARGSESPAVAPGPSGRTAKPLEVQDVTEATLAAQKARDEASDRDGLAAEGALVRLRDLLRSNNWTGPGLSEMLRDQYGAETIEELNEEEAREAMGVVRDPALRDRFVTRAREANAKARRSANKDAP